jgi:hypothetical protein
VSSQKSLPAPLALEWLCFLRDHGQDLKLTLGERALASLLPTYGEGKNIFVSTAKLAKITGWSETTVRKHRNGLIARGLLEDVTGDPDRQLRTYRLIMPGYVEPPQNLTPSPADIEGVPPQILTPSPSESDPNIKHLDQDLDQATTSSLPAAPEEVASQSFQGQSQTQDPGRASSATGSLASGDPKNTFIVWQAKSGPRAGEWVDYTAARPPRHQPKDAVTVSLSLDEARYLRETWPMLSARTPALRAESAENRARYLLMNPDERAAVVFGTQSDEVDPPEDRILAYLTEHDELDARSGLPDDLSDLGVLLVLETCEKVSRATGLYGSRSLRRFGLTDEGRARLNAEFPEHAVLRCLAKRRNGISEHVLDEVAGELGIKPHVLRAVLLYLTGTGHAEKSGSYYRMASRAA